MKSLSIILLSFVLLNGCATHTKKEETPKIVKAEEPAKIAQDDHTRCSDVLAVIQHLMFSFQKNNIYFMRLSAQSTFNSSEIQDKEFIEKFTAIFASISGPLDEEVNRAVEGLLILSNCVLINEDKVQPTF